MTKKVLTTITDCDTGEVLYQPRDFNKGGKPLTFNIHEGSFTGEDACKRVFESFMRGVKTGRNLNLCITIRDLEPIQELPFWNE